ncbi:MAG: TIGR00289 family protein [Candidatus Aenigmatarchaeota archaeon]
MRLAALLSGGKDSLYSMYLAKKHGHKIKYIISIISENPESYMFHVPNIEFVKQQAKAMQIPIIQKMTKGIKEEELLDLEKVLKKIRKNIDGVVTGAVASVYQKTRIDKICEVLELKSIAPLWNTNPEKILNNMLNENFDILITAVAAPPMDENWLGRKLDKRCLNELINLNKLYRISINGEGGEYETFVLDCPLFKSKIEILDYENFWDKKTNSGFMQFKKIKLVKKNSKSSFL